MIIDTKKIKKGSIIFQENNFTGEILKYMVYYAGYKHINFTMIDSKHAANGCGYYSKREKLDEWFSNFNRAKVIKIIY